MKYLIILTLLTSCAFEQKEKVLGSKETIEYFINTDYGILIVTKKEVKPILD